jgi:hypothetical protein
MHSAAHTWMPVMKKSVDVDRALSNDVVMG